MEKGNRFISWPLERGDSVVICVLGWRLAGCYDVLMGRWAYSGILWVARGTCAHDRRRAYCA